ncbi:hypothetical protein ACSDQ9_04040 [Aestuariimicrobium soli]|uniref:hypothetical protein n=1 Tax=Aestuariimicrobium soli TaxID=2035834 RepID=UPI003EB86D3A
MGASEPVAALHVLGIPVEPTLLERWRGWYCHPQQPFRVDTLPARWRPSLPEPTPGGVPADLEAVAETRDTFFMYGGGEWVWLGERDLADADPELRRWLVAERRRRIVPKPAPVWPSHPAVTAALVRWIEQGCRTSLHSLAAGSLAAAAKVLPGAADLAGTFPDGSGANCFGTVMAASGQSTAESWVGPDAFTAWLDDHTSPVTAAAHDDANSRPGTVLVWHERGALAHAAITLGEGWALHKPSQAWCSPRIVVRVEELIHSWVYPGARLSRHRLST